MHFHFNCVNKIAGFDDMHILKFSIKDKRDKSGLHIMRYKKHAIDTSLLLLRHLIKLWIADVVGGPRFQLRI